MNLVAFSLVIIFLVFGGMLLYRFDGRKTVFHIDFVQFIYTFLVLPLLFVVFKIFLYQTLSQLALMNNRSLFAVDTLFSVLFLYLSAAKAVHAVTKSFSLKVKSTPSFDIFQISEYLHMWWSHLAMYGLVLFGLAFVSITNLMFPLVASDLTRQGFFACLAFGILMGLILYTVVWNTKLSKGNFENFMKFIFALFFVLHATVYIKFRPSFSSEYLVFWMVFTLFVTTVIGSFFLERSRRVQRWRALFRPASWGIEGKRE